VAKSVLNLAGHLALTHDVEVISLFRRRRRPVYGRPAGVRMTYLDDRRAGRDAARQSRRGVARALTGIPSVLIHRTDPMYDSCSALTDVQLVRRLRSMTSGVLITTRPSLHILAAQYAPARLVVIAQEHMNSNTRPKSLWRSMIRASPGLDAFVTLTKRDRRDIARSVGSSPPLVRSIPNASPAALGGVDSSRRSKVVVAAGRLKHQKGFDRLVEAFDQVAAAHPEWQLHIYGRGSQRSALQRMIDERELQDQITLMGWTDRLGSVLAEASVFALSSRFEGLPLVGIEALTAGLPVVAFDCPRGPRELVRDGENGYLLANGDVTGYGAALSRLIEDEALRQNLGDAARVDAGTYEIHEIGGRWRRLIDKLVTDKATGTGASRKRPGLPTMLRMAASLLFELPRSRLKHGQPAPVHDRGPKVSA
jgi:glycosyltransferase involved in cell wall biosynthesis